MASLCAKCGTDLVAGATTCRCGAAAGPGVRRSAPVAGEAEGGAARPGVPAPPAWWPPTPPAGGWPDPGPTRRRQLGRRRQPGRKAPAVAEPVVPPAPAVRIVVRWWGPYGLAPFGLPPYGRAVAPREVTGPTAPPGRHLHARPGRRPRSIPPVWWAGTEPPAALVGPTRRAQVALLVLVAVLAAVVLPRWGPPNPSADGPPVAVAVSLVDGPGLAVGYGLPVVWVTLGRDGPVEVELDTGSVGLRVLASALPHGRRSGIHVTAADDVVEYGDGTVLDSLVADATLGLGGVRSSGPVAFGLVQKVVCDPSVVDCPAADRQAPFGDPTIQGILGVGLDWPEGAPQVVNPLTELPGRYARSWSLALQNGASGGGGALVLGAPEPAHPAALFQLQKQGADATGAETYSDYPSACWAVDRVRTCGETLFDSGTEAMFLDGAFGSVGTGAIDGLRLVDPRSTVSAACDPRTRPRTCSSTHPFWRFSAGGTIGRNAVLVTKDAGFVNSGVQAFFDFTITYDDAAGRIYLVPQP